MNNELLYNSPEHILYTSLVVDRVRERLSDVPTSDLLRKCVSPHENGEKNISPLLYQTAMGIVLERTSEQ